MSIIGYAGLPGSGKSYSAVENVVIPALKAGRPVAHNLTLNEACLTAVCGHDVSRLLIQIPMDCTASELIAIPPPGAVIVIDEVWRYWPAGTKANEVPKDELKFFKEHRHRCDDQNRASEIVILDQDLGTGIPAFLRSLIETTYLHTKQTAIGAKTRYRVEVYARCQSALKPQKTALLRKMLGKYKPEVFNCYSSHTQAVNVGEAGLEQMPDDRANVWRSWPVRSAIVALCALPFLLWWVSSSFSAIASTPQKAATLSTPTPSPTYAPAPRLPPPTPHPVAQGENRTASAAVVERSDPTPPPLPTPTPLSREWRVLGGVARKDGSKSVIVVASATGRRLLSQDDCEIDHLLRWSCQMEDGRATSWSGGATSPLYAGRPEGFGGY